MKLLLVLSLITASLILGGCVNAPSLEDSSPPPIHYILKAGDTPDVKLEKPVIIKVIQPTLAEGLDTERMAVIEQGRKIRYLQQARWAGGLGDVLKRFAMDSLNQVDNLTALGEEDYSLPTDYQLLIDISALQAEYEQTADAGTPTTRISGRLILMNYRNNEILGIIPIRAHQTIHTNSVTAITESYEAMLRESMANIIELLP